MTPEERISMALNQTRSLKRWLERQTRTYEQDGDDTTAYALDDVFGAVERSLPVDTWLEAQLIARRADHDKYLTRITEQETR